MSLYSSIQLANNALRATQIGLQVVGQNISNVNTPGYIREEAVFTTAATQRRGDLLLGLGVNVEGVVQKIDRFLEERLRNATSDRVGAEAQERTYIQLEGLLGELSDTDLSTALTAFFNSISEVLNQPESLAVRNLVALQGETLAGEINRTATRAREIHESTNSRVISVAGDINRLIDEVHDLNLRVVSIEAGGNSSSDAVGVRDQRGLALAKLAELIDIKVKEQPDGGVSVFTGGDYLIFEAVKRNVSVNHEITNGLNAATIVVEEIEIPISTRAGELAGLVESRDTILGGFLGQLDDLTATLIFEFNKVYSGGQGLVGFESLTSEFAVDGTDVPLDAAGLRFTPTNGSFDVLVTSTQTGLTETTTVSVDLNGLDDDATLADIVAALDAIEGISATTTAGGNLTIDSDSAELQFSFAGDTSGLLAALGINTFFQGTGTLDIGVRQELKDDPARFAASGSGIGADTDVAVVLAAFLERPLESQNGSTLADLQRQLTTVVTQGTTVAKSVADGFRVFEESLQGEHLAITGVNLDEEAVRLIGFQQTFQATARYIATLSDLLEVLVNL